VTGAEARAGEGTAIVAGYRVLRRIASSVRSDVYLGASSGTTADGRREVVVLKVFHSRETVTAHVAADVAANRAVDVGSPEDPGADIDRVVSALAAVEGGGAGRLLDVATLPDGRVCLVLLEDRGGSLGRLLAEERMLEPGEVVTILAPVLAALAQLYDRGWVHPGIGPGTIRFDGTGRPVVGGLGRLRDLPPPGRARDELLADARVGFDDLLHAVLDRVVEDGEGAATASGLTAAWQVGTYREALAGLERALFEWSSAAPVRLGAHTMSPGDAAGEAQPDAGTRAACDSGRAGRHGPALRTRVDARRVHRPRGTSATRAAHVRSTGTRGRAGGSRALAGLERALDERPGALLSAWAGRFARVVGRHVTGGKRQDSNGFGAKGPNGSEGSERPELDEVRKRTHRPQTRRGTWRAPDDPARWRRRGLLLAGGCGAVVLLVGAWTALAPSVARPGPGLSTGAPVFSAPSETGGGAMIGTAAPPGAARGPASGPTPAEQETLQGEDPAAATAVLLRVRTLCIAAADEDCLVQISQPDSPALAADTARIADATDGAATMIDAPAPTVVDRIGNLALVAFSGPGAGPDPGHGTEPANDKPASVLVVKGEAGWRLREFFGGD
jgi:hypothetical protein